MIPLIFKLHKLSFKNNTHVYVILHYLFIYLENIKLYTVVIGMVYHVLLMEIKTEIFIVTNV